MFSNITCFDFFFLVLIFYKEPELDAEIDPGMALTQLPSSIEWGSNPQPSDCELSALPLDYSCFSILFGGQTRILASGARVQ